MRGTEDFNVRKEVHQGSSLNPYLFSLVINEIIKDIQSEQLWCMLFDADNMVLIDLEKVNGRF